MIANSVVLPAPLGPISAVMRPAGAASEAASSASSPPKRFDTRSTASRGSDRQAIGPPASVARAEPVAIHARPSAKAPAMPRGAKRHDQNQHARRR